jgi:hypothetical protein
MAHYRPIVLAKRGELTAIRELPSSVWASMSPVLQVPPREWDFVASTYKKTLEEHLADLPKKLATATKGHHAYIDVSQLDSLGPVFGGRHPLEWIVEEAATHSLGLIPFVQASSDPSTIAAAAAIHARRGTGAGIRLTPNEWVSINPRVLAGLLTSVGVAANETDVFIDVSREFSVVIARGVLTELTAQDAAYAFRSRSVGGAAFPDTNGLAKGLSEFSREDWNLFVSTYRVRLAADATVPDFFDNVVQNPDVEVGAVDPRLLSISALFRYTTDGDWLIAKGDLFKGSGGRGIGGAAMLTPLTLLRAHPKFTIPIRTSTDDWIDAVVAGTKSPGNPEAWRRWATERHLTVVAHQVSSPI